MRKGWLNANPAQPCVVEREAAARDGEPSFELPDKTTLADLLKAAAEGGHPVRDTAVVRLLMFGGFRISELLGAADDAAVIRPQSMTLKVCEKLDRHYKTLAPLKAAKSRRDVPLGQAAALAVRAWRLSRGPARAFSHRDGKHQTRRVSERLFPDPRTGVRERLLASAHAPGRAGPVWSRPCPTARARTGRSKPSAPTCSATSPSAYGWRRSRARRPRRCRSLSATPGFR